MCVLWLVSACWWVRLVLRLAQAHCWVGPGILGLVPDHWWVELGSQGLWLEGPGGIRSSAGALLCGTRFWALWWAGPCPGVAVGSEGLKAACLLVGEAVSLPG